MTDIDPLKYDLLFERFLKDVYKRQPELIAIAIEAEYDEEQQRDALRRLLRKAAALAPYENDDEMKKYKAKIIRRMLSKGFSQSMIWDELDILLTSAGR